MEHIVDHGSLIEGLGGAASIEAETGFKAVTIGAWKAKGRIANEAWGPIIELCSRRGLKAGDGAVIDANWLLSTMRPRERGAPRRIDQEAA